MAPVEKRVMMASIGSTSSMGMGPLPPGSVLARLAALRLAGGPSTSRSA